MSEKILSRDFRLPTVLALVLLIVYFLFSRMDSLWSTGSDIGLHGVLVTRLMEKFRIWDAWDMSLNEMNYYPPYTHILSATVGRAFGSPVIGIQVVILISIVGGWLAIGLASLRLPARVASTHAIVLAALFLLNEKVVKLEVFGHEIIGNFFFAHLVAQALALIVIFVFARMESLGRHLNLSYLVLVLACPVIAGFHLLPALEILGFLGLNVVLDWWMTPRRPVATLAKGAVFVAVGTGLIVLNPAFLAMRTNAEHEGSLGLLFTPTATSVLLLAGLVAALSVVAIRLWWPLAREAAAKKQWSYLRTIATFGMAVSILCALQYVAWLAGYGSSYGVKKYAFALNTVLFLFVALGLASAIAELFRRFLPNVSVPQPYLSALIVLVAPVMLIFAPTYRPSKGDVDVSILAESERLIRLYRELNLPDNGADRADYAVGLANLPAAADFLVSMSALRAPRGETIGAIYMEQSIPHPEKIRYFISSAGSLGWDFPDCRADAFSSFVVLNSACVLSKRVSKCTGTLDLTSNSYVSSDLLQGFGWAEPHGRWSDGPQASLICGLTEGRAPSAVRLTTGGFVPGEHTQRMVIKIDGVDVADVSYDAANSQRQIVIPLPPPRNNAIRLDFAFPNAASPEDLGLGADTRRLGVSIRDVTFLP